jgi:rare lipoprotein A
MKKNSQTALVAVTMAACLMVVASASSASSAAAQCGRASWYALHSKTASGERMNPSAMTAAHRSLPFGTKLKVTNQDNGRSVVVRINDRGPFIKGRVLDLSKGAANQLGFIGSGHTAVCMARV